MCVQLSHRQRQNDKEEKSCDSVEPRPDLGVTFCFLYRKESLIRNWGRAKKSGWEIRASSSSRPDMFAPTRSGHLFLRLLLPPSNLCVSVYNQMGVVGSSLGPMAGKLAPVSHVRHGSLGLLLFSFFPFLTHLFHTSCRLSHASHTGDIIQSDTHYNNRLLFRPKWSTCVV
jgi:hypothetical protein